MLERFTANGFGDLMVRIEIVCRDSHIIFSSMSLFVVEINPEYSVGGSLAHEVVRRVQSPQTHRGFTTSFSSVPDCLSLME